jgi:glycosyltransferase involved in cell wall biosynthesis
MTSTRRPKVVVATWAVNHNPIGRAHVLAELLSHNFDVEIVGFEFPAYGSGVWPPVRNGRIPVTAHAGTAFPEQLDIMESVGRALHADAVLVSKPRLPGLAVAALAKEARNRALVVDVDDWELSFVHAEHPVDVDDVDAIQRDDTKLTPYGRIWTQVCESLVAEADACTVSNVQLQLKFGGTVIPHARDEQLFDPTRFDRARVRERFGIDPDTKLLVFGGTPRRHKGVVDLARAIAELGDPSLVLGLIATPELAEVRRDLDEIGCPLLEIPSLPFEDMPAVLAAADLTAVLQDPASPISRHQMPAKVTDALAMQVPCIVNPVPPLQHLIDADVLVAVGPDGLTATLKRVVDDFGAAQHKARVNRDVFLDQFSHAAVAPRLADVMRTAMESPMRLSTRLRSLLGVQRALFAPTPAPVQEPPADTRHVRVRRKHRAHGSRRDDPFDLVVFWKQNDSGIYGRRSDQLIHHIAQLGRVARTIHFDAPLGIEQLRNIGQSGGIDHNQMVFETTIRRVLGQEDDEAFTRRTFLFDDRGDRFDLPRRDEFGDFVAEIFATHAIGQRDVVFWVYPTNRDVPGLIDRFRPTVVVSDVVDDNRTWYPVGSNDHRKLTDNYAEILVRSDVVLANCAAVRDAMSELHADIQVVPNACEPPEALQRGDRGAPPAELAALNGPIIGYVGNLSSRIDIPLLEHVAVTRPDWNIVLIGSAHAGHDVVQLARHDNIKILGPRRHEDAQRYIDAFDVAIIPHVDNEMTRSMHPLKAFVYCSLGVPVVATELANLDELRDLITTATNPTEFVHGIERAIQRGRQPLSQRQLATLRSNSWPVRARRALKLVDDALQRSAAHPVERAAPVARSRPSS